MKREILLMCSIVCFNLYGQKSTSAIIERVTVIPTHISQSYENRDVIIKNGKISLIREHLEGDTSKYDLKIDGTDKFLMAGMVDAHAHFPPKEEIGTYFAMNLMNGVTTLRSMRGEDWHLELRDETGLTPNLILGSPPFRRSDSISTLERGELVEKYKRQKFDFIKVLSLPDAISFNELVKSCQKHSIGLAGHCSSPILYNVAIESGVYESIEHLHGVGRLREFDEIVRTTNVCVEKGIAFTPTTDWYMLSPFSIEELRNRAGTKFVSEKKIQEWEDEISTRFDTLSELQKEKLEERKKRNYDYRTRLTSFAYKQGINLLVGPDLEGVYGIPGFGYVEELKHFRKAGMSNLDILKAATFNMALVRKEASKWGSICTGASADLVLLSENPLDEIENVTSIEGILLRGTYYSKEELEKNLESLPKYN